MDNALHALDLEGFLVDQVMIATDERLMATDGD